MKPSWLVMIVLLGLACGCSKRAKPAEESETTVSFDHVAHLKIEESKDLVHGVFPVTKYAQFAFVVPANEGYPRLHGGFRAFTNRRNPDSTSDQTADVGLMLLNDQEFNDFQHGRPGSTTYELTPAHDQAVDWRVPNTNDQPQQYHLVFSNSDGGAKTKFVKADFTITFQ